MTTTAKETIAILDFGAQYSQLIARRVRENHVFSVLVNPSISPEELKAMNVTGLILSGGPSSVYDEGAPKCDPAVLRMGIPVLGICYGMQIGCQALGGAVNPTETREYGRTPLRVSGKNELLGGLPEETSVWMSHGDVVNQLSDEFERLAATPTCPYAAVKHVTLPFYGVQFHPEVTHTPQGSQILRNFLYTICGCTGDWQVGSLVEETIAAVRDRVGTKQKVICGLSGGVDSSVTAALLHQAIGDRLVCIFVNNGLLRKNEVAMVESTFRDHFKMNLRVVDAEARFLKALAGVTDPQEKRKAIGHEFIEVFKAEAETIENATFLAQGTLYPDVIESGHSAAGTAAAIKLHHNVGGLPAELGFELIEPLRELFKDEVRHVGEHLGLPEDMVWRHPFPGPGLAVRIIGEVTKAKLDTLRDADQIVIEEILAAGWYRKIAQGFAVLLPISSVGVMGDGRSYEGQQAIAVRFVESTDFMTADWVHIDPQVLSQISTRITNEVAGINRVVYDISSKPPATIEWE
jgi:GMP synthase (glutamine-hydrolysing)